MIVESVALPLWNSGLALTHLMIVLIFSLRSLLSSQILHLSLKGIAIGSMVVKTVLLRAEARIVVQDDSRSRCCRMMFIKRPQSKRQRPKKMMSSFTIPSSSSFSLSNLYTKPSRHHHFILRNSNFEFRRLRLGLEPPRRRRTRLQCNCSNKSTNGENENKSVLDAFFLGKALAEVINERIESTVGEVLGTIGKFQAEQQKQVQEIQEEVLERAKKAKERAARETMEEQGLVASKSTTTTINRNPSVGVVTSVSHTLTVASNTITGSVEESSSSSDEDSV